MKKTLIIVSAIGLAAAAFSLGLFCTKKNQPVEPPPNGNLELRQNNNNNNSSYNFINPLLECSEINNISNKKINKIKSRVLNFITDDKKNSSDFIAVYFRDLNNGPWFGVNEKENFTPKSLLKVPLLMCWLKIIEANPGIIEQKVFFEKSFPGQYWQYYKPKQEIEPGREYSVKNLIEAMIKYSDNSAALILNRMITPEELYNIYKDLGVEEPKDQQYVLSVRTYASFFRILFNATYASKPLSELALTLLSETDFKDGLRAGVPEHIAVAHKFGEYDIDGEINKRKQLHDCGIVYYPDQPYILCVMTRGDDFNALAADIKNISRLVYEGVREE